MKQTLAKVNNSTDEVSKAAAQIGDTTDGVNEEIKETMAMLQDAATSIKKLSEETRAVVKIVKREADDLPGTASRVNSTVRDTQDLVEEVSGHWLLGIQGISPYTLCHPSIGSEVSEQW